jgi:hypothetical protein
VDQITEFAGQNMPKKAKENPAFKRIRFSILLAKICPKKAKENPAF